MTRTSRLLFAATTVAALTCNFGFAAATTYRIDPVHSSVGFTIRHFFSPVPASFTKFSGEITFDRDNPANDSVVANIDVASIDTRNQTRDNDLRSPHFFEVAKFPMATFKSTSWKPTGENTFDVTGDLTLHGVTKPVVLAVKSLGFGPGMQGHEISGWEAKTTLNRNDFGITRYPKMLGDHVPITITIEADKQ